MSDSDPQSEGLKLVSKFAGEAFGTDNVRTVFASASQDNVERDDRIIVLIGPAGTGKSTLIDCMCNYFYGADLKSDTRYKIADEIFDHSTPIKTIIKYVFNETKMPYRPIVIDTPGIGSESGVQTDAEISEMLSSFLLQSHRVVIHAIGFVLKYSDSRVSLKREAQIKETLAMFPKWMMPNVVPILSSSDGTGTIPSPIRALFKHLGLCENKVFFFNSGSLFDVSKAEAITEQLRTTYWNMTMEGLEGFFEHVGVLNPQCIAEELPAPPQSKSPSLAFEKRINSELHTPNYTPPPPPPPPLTDRISRSSAKDLSTTYKSSINSTSQANATSTGLLADINSDGAPYSKIRKTSNETRTEEHRERIIPIKLLHTPSKTTLQMERNQVSGSRHSFVEPTTQQSTKYDTMQVETESGSVIKRYTYDPSSMSHKEFILKGPGKKEITTGNGMDLVKDTPFPNKGSSVLRPQVTNETLINDVPMENLVSSGNYKHIKSSPPPDYSPKPVTQRTPLATLAGADQLSSGNIQQRTSTSINIDGDASTTHFSRSSTHRQVEKRSSARDMKGSTPLTELPSALSVGSDWTYHTGDELNAAYFDHSMQR
uniref:Rad50/SbcC-type AAA domain-containing protein n=1 Tax=Ascaris lumbricoides TaxID=6252 RepID=A0A9J2PST9_ASCLU